MSEENGIFQPVDLSPEMQRESERRDMEIMRNLPNATPKYEINLKNLLPEMNVRMAQYIEQFKSLPFEYLIMQTVRDFAQLIYDRHELTGTEAKQMLDRSHPVAVTIKGNKSIFANPAIRRSDYEDGLVMLFVYKLDFNEIQRKGG